MEPKDAKVSQAIDPWRLDLAHQKSKRIRTIFSSEQLQRLEKEFKNQQYMVGAERLLLASDLQLSEAQVKVWFQNRRIKWRKENHERDQAKLADYRTRREEIRRKLGLSQRRRIVVGSLRGKRSSVGDDVRAKQPMISHEEETCSNVSMEKCYHHE
ncbi:Homeobox protein not2 [Holothuria leucospilota]|uniref:Homeobox protein not2 n=1 Tax=Holothuria leucospilota TaxID=206669 RepID=A0A9Q1BI92_HOLLE|nr:Homeobox protein not2 [Holothuria leucospilota]